MLGHNNPPSAIDDALTPYGDAITEAEGWLDGTEVTTEGQMKAVDALIKEIKAAKKAVEAAEESEAKPIYDAWKAAKDQYKPTLTDLDRIVKGLVATVDAFKRRLAAEKEAARKKAEAEAWEATRKAQEAARQAAETDIEAQRAAAQAQADAEAAQRLAMDAKRDTVKGLRSVTRTVVVDPLALARWLWINDKDATLEYQAERARKLGLNLPGIAEQVTTKEAF